MPPLHAGDSSEARLETECRRVLGAPPHSIVPLRHSVRLGITRGVWRVAADGAQAIVKVVGAASADERDRSRVPGNWRYWRREALVMAEASRPHGGMLAPYRDAGLRPPRLLRAFDRGPDEVALWLEDVGAQPGTAFDLEGFRDVARRLGIAQGTAARRRLPAEPWLSRCFLDDYLAEFAAAAPYDLLDADEAWRRPMIVERWPPGLRDGLVRLHADRARLLAWLDRSSPTLAHLDVWPNNLFTVDDGVVLIDWAFAGRGRLGEDPSNLVLNSAFDLLFPASMLPAIDGEVQAGYLEGLDEAGWPGDGRVVRLAMCAAAVKFDWLGPAMLGRATDVRQPGYGGIAEDPVRLFEELGTALAFVVACADEARCIAHELALD